MIRKLKCAALAALAILCATTTFVSAQDKLPEPESPKKMVLENGRIEVYIGTPRVSDYQISDSMRVTLVFVLTPDSMWKAKQKPASPGNVLPEAAPKAQPERKPGSTDDGSAKIEEPTILEMPVVELEGLRMGVISSQASDVEVLGPATVESYIQEDGRKMVVATVYVNTFTTTQKKQVSVAPEFMYAIANLSHGQPDWHSATAPELLLGTTLSASENQTRLVEGDLTPKATPRAPITYWLLFGSLPFAVPLLVALAFAGWRRLNPETEVSINESTWAEIERVVAEAEKAGGFTIEHYRRIFAALRKRFDVLGLDTTQILDALGARPDLDHEAVEYVFNRETVFFDPKTQITAERHAKLMKYIGKLLGRQ